MCVCCCFYSVTQFYIQRWVGYSDGRLFLFTGLVCSADNACVSTCTSALGVCAYVHAPPSPSASSSKPTESTLSSSKDREMLFFPVWVILEKWAPGLRCSSNLACSPIRLHCLFWLNLRFFIWLPRKLQVRGKCKARVIIVNRCNAWIQPPLSA